MVLALIAVLIGGAAGLVGGGRFKNVERVDLRWIGLPVTWIALGLWARRGGGGLHFAALLVSMGCLLGFVVLNAKRVPGLWLVAAGVALNLFMTANNHGMPYDPHALQVAGIVPSTYGAVPRSTVASHPQHAGDQLVVLGEVIPLRPLRMVVSFGDLFVAFGLGASTMNALVATGSLRTGSRAPRHRRGSALEPAGARPSGSGPALSNGSWGSAIADPTLQPAPDEPFADIEIRRVVSILDDERSVIDLASEPGGTIDATELSARFVVRQSLARHGLPERLLHADADQTT